MDNNTANRNIYITKDSNDESKISSFLDFTPPPKQDLGPSLSLSYIYSTPPSLTLTNDADLTHYTSLISKGPPFPMFPRAGGSGIAYLNFGPNPDQQEAFWHRTKTVDYIVVLNGELELSLSSGEKRVVSAGDVVVQRAPMHRWKNLSRTEGATFVAMALGAEGAVEGEMEFGEGIAA